MSDLIRNELYMSQVKDYNGLRFPGGIHPTDIDLSMDFDHGEVFIFAELKHYSKPALENGQRYHYEALCRKLVDGGSSAFCLVATHSSEPGQRIDVATCLVVRIYNGSEWLTPGGHVTLRDYIEQLRSAHEDGKRFDFDTLFDSIGGRPKDGDGVQ